MLAQVHNFTLTQVLVGSGAKFYTNSQGGANANFYVELDTGWHQYQVSRRLRYVSPSAQFYTDSDTG